MPVDRDLKFADSRLDHTLIFITIHRIGAPVGFEPAALPELIKGSTQFEAFDGTSDSG